MRLTVIIFTLVFGILSFAPNMQGGQFFKLSEVVEHFNEHQSGEDSFNSFLSFVKEHYFKNHHTNDDEKQLPFKSHMASVSLMVIPNCQLGLVQETVSLGTAMKHNFGDPHGIIQGKEISIWNPPRMS